MIGYPAGDSGDLSHYGGNEHAAFWTDCENKCEWSGLGAVSIEVHDLASIPADGVAGTAAFEVGLAAFQRVCQNSETARVWAVLPGATLPSAADPDALTTRANWPRADCFDTHVLTAERAREQSIVGSQPGEPEGMTMWAFVSTWAKTGDGKARGTRSRV